MESVIGAFAEDQTTTARQPLDGTLVVEVSVTIPGPYASALLRRLGARVIKFEPPDGDITRRFPNLYQALNGGKESVVADLKRPEGRALVQAAAARADVFVEGWRPGVAARLGIGLQACLARNPMLVYCSISGYGATSGLRDRPGHDLNYVAASGMAQLLCGNEKPANPKIPFADLAGGTFAALRILAALVEARATQRGAHVDVSLAGAARDWVEAIGGAASDHPLDALPELPHYGVFETADGHHLTLGTVHEDHFWRSLCDVLDMRSHAAFSFQERAARCGEIRLIIAERIAERTRPELEQMFAGADTCWAFVDPAAGEKTFGGMIPRHSRKAPGLDEHGPAVRAQFGERGHSLPSAASGDLPHERL